MAMTCGYAQTQGPLPSGAASAKSTAGPITRSAAVQSYRGRPQSGGTIQAIKIEGNQRIEEGTIRSYMLVSPGDPYDPDRIDRSLKALYATGLFSDVNIRRDGDTLVVHVVE